MRLKRLLAMLPLVAILAAGCAQSPTTRTSGSTSRPPPPDAVPREEPRSRYGNGPTYEVFGRQYRVMESSHGYVERGVASWYGRKFHGRLTSSREPYDMYAMTAAHKSLPLPTYVEVRNLANDRRVVVRVNDRGPFVKNRLIDLSYAAATKLGIVQAGTGMVEVRAISFDDAPTPATAAGEIADPRPDSQPLAAPEPAPVDTVAAESAGLVAGEESAAQADIYVQVGAFGDPANAERRHRLLVDSGIRPSFVHRDADRQPAIYRVRIGPLEGVDEYDTVIDELGRIGITESHIVTE